MERLRGRGPHLVGIAAVIVFFGALLGTCRDPQPRTLPEPSGTASTDAAPVTTDPDFSLIGLPAIDGRTTTTPPATAGPATIKGVVEGPDGRVPGAIVRAERLVGDVVQPFEVRTGDDGTFSLARVPGGRYRVRAFLPPSLAMGDPEIFFQPAFETREVRLRLERFTGFSVTSDTAPGQPVVGGGVNLAVRVSERRVGDDGIAREVPLPGVLVQVSSSGWTELDPGATLVTDGDGIAVFQYRCDRVGSVSATAIVGDGSSSPPPSSPSPSDGSAPAPPASPPPSGPDGTYPLDVPGCAPRPTTTTTTTTTSEPTSSTSRPRGTTSSTSTTTSTTEP